MGASRHGAQFQKKQRGRPYLKGSRLNTNILGNEVGHLGPTLSSLIAATSVAVADERAFQCGLAGGAVGYP